MNPSKKINEFIKGSSILIMSNIVLKAINFFLLPLYTKYLPPAELGISDTIANAASFLLPILVLAFDSAFSAFYYERQDEEYKSQIFNTVFWVLFFQGCIPIIMLFFGDQISFLLFRNYNMGFPTRIALLSISANLWVLPFSLLTRIKNRMKLFAMINISTSLLMIILNIIFVSQLRWGGYSLIFSSAIVQVIQLIMYVIFVRIKISVKYFNYSLYKALLKYALPLIPTTVATWILSLSDRYIILIYHGESAVGIYGIGTRFVLFLSVIISGISTAYTSFAFGNLKNPNAKKQFVKVVDIIFILLSGICYTISIFAKEIISIMADKQYGTAYILIANLLFAQLIYSVTTLIGYGIAFAKKSIYYFVSVSAAAVLNIILNFIYIPRYGIYAASATTLAGYIVMFFITYVAAQKFYPCNYGIVKMIFLFFVSYFSSSFIVNQPFYCKCGLWSFLTVTIFVLYFKNIKETVTYLKLLIKNKIQ